MNNRVTRRMRQLWLTEIYAVLPSSPDRLHQRPHTQFMGITSCTPQWYAQYIRHDNVGGSATCAVRCHRPQCMLCCAAPTHHPFRATSRHDGDFQRCSINTPPRPLCRLRWASARARGPLVPSVPQVQLDPPVPPRAAPQGPPGRCAGSRPLSEHVRREGLPWGAQPPTRAAAAGGCARSLNGCDHSRHAEGGTPRHPRLSVRSA